MRVLVCGGRTFGYDRSGHITEDADHLFDALQELLELYGTSLSVIHGGARGADALAGMWADYTGVPCTVFPADWNRYGLAAGSKRNTQMLDEGRPDIVLACPGGPGTRNMIKQATNRKIPVRCIN
jgi:hypothetical protein